MFLILIELLTFITDYFTQKMNNGIGSYQILFDMIELLLDKY
jgi:hypothetical protein